MTFPRSAGRWSTSWPAERKQAVLGGRGPALVEPLPAQETFRGILMRRVKEAIP